jgi:hypothetical protein
MKYVLLTGAGFTRNWGGWLARELEGDLLSRVSLNPALRALLQHARGFEDALETLQRAHTHWKAHTHWTPIEYLACLHR